MKIQNNHHWYRGWKIYLTEGKRIWQYWIRFHILKLSLYFLYPRLSLLPAYNRTGWLGVKNQLTYLITYLLTYPRLFVVSSNSVFFFFFFWTQPCFPFLCIFIWRAIRFPVALSFTFAFRAQVRSGQWLSICVTSASPQNGQRVTQTQQRELIL